MPGTTNNLLHRERIFPPCWQRIAVCSSVHLGLEKRSNKCARHTYAGRFCIFCAYLPGGTDGFGAEIVHYMDCPWNLVRYGGRSVYWACLKHARSVCPTVYFPTGTSGAGYAWVSLFLYLDGSSCLNLDGACQPQVLIGAIFGWSCAMR